MPYIAKIFRYCSFRLLRIWKNIYKTFFEKYPTKAQDVLNILLDHYAEYGYTQLEEPRKVLQLNKFEKLGGYKTILTQIFEEPEKFDNALKEIMIRVYK